MQGTKFYCDKPIEILDLKENPTWKKHGIIG